MITSNTKTPLSHLGEFKLIEHLTQHFKLNHSSTVKGIGDDCAVLKPKAGYQQVVTTDLLVEGVHFNVMYTPLKHLGYKAVSVNVSDICAMNAQPLQLLVSIAVSSRYTVEALEELYSGIQLACERYNVDLIGGDTTTTPYGLTISITCIGVGKKEHLVYRHTAQEKDLICVTGDLGGAYLGLQVLEREKVVFLENPRHQPDLDAYQYIIERQLKPEARVDVIEQLKKANVLPTSMIDVSDGLSSEILHLCKQSGLGAKIYEDKLPIDTETFQVCTELNMTSTTCALNGGEDYELLFTIKQSDFETVKAMPSVHIIGYMLEEGAGVYLADKNNHLFELSAQGWTAFE